MASAPYRLKVRRVKELGGNIITPYHTLAYALRDRIMRARAEKVQGKAASNLDDNPQGFILYIDFCVEEVK